MQDNPPPLEKQKNRTYLLQYRGWQWYSSAIYLGHWPGNSLL